MGRLPLMQHWIGLFGFFPLAPRAWRMWGKSAKPCRRSTRGCARWLPRSLVSMGVLGWETRTRQCPWGDTALPRALGRREGGDT